MKRLFHLALLSLILLSCTPREAQVQRFSDFALDTTVRFTFYGEGDNRLFEESMTEIRRLEELLSYHREGSEIYELSKQAGGQWVTLSA